MILEWGVPQKKILRRVVFETGSGILLLFGELKSFLFFVVKLFSQQRLANVSREPHRLLGQQARAVEKST